MRSLTAIGFLVLLIYHLIGLPVAVLTFDQSYESAAPVSGVDRWKLVKLPIALPYTAAWENPDGQEGLIQEGDEFYNIVHQQYANDTLYTLLKTNQNARERFVELAEQLQVLNTGQTAPKTPLGRLLKLLKDRLTNYLPPLAYGLAGPHSTMRPAAASPVEPRLAFDEVIPSVASPPPQA